MLRPVCPGTVPSFPHNTLIVKWVIHGERYSWGVFRQTTLKLSFKRAIGGFWSNKAAGHFLLWWGDSTGRLFPLLHLSQVPFVVWKSTHHTPLKKECFSVLWMCHHLELFDRFRRYYRSYCRCELIHSGWLTAIAARNVHLLCISSFQRPTCSSPGDFTP